MKQLNYNHLYYFYITAREGSISKASAVLHLTAQTISGQISTFEDNLGVELFDRRGKRLYLNTMGKLTYEYAESIFNIGNDLLEKLRSQDHLHYRKFDIGIVDAVPKILTLDIVQSVIRQELSTRFIFSEGNFNQLTAALATNKIDLIISDRPLTPDSRIKAQNHFLFETGISFFADQRQSAKLEADFPSSLNGQPMLLPSESTHLRRSLSGWLSDNQVYPDIVAEFDDSALLKLFGGQDFGVFTSPSTIEKDVEQQYQVKCIGRTDEVTERYYAITPEGGEQHPLVKQIINEGKQLGLINL
jgi:LysR family transcriptional activator of nhaA